MHYAGGSLTLNRRRIWVAVVLAVLGRTGACATVSYPAGAGVGSEVVINTMSPTVTQPIQGGLCDRTVGGQPGWCATLSARARDDSRCGAKNQNWWTNRSCSIAPSCRAAAAEVQGLPAGSTSGWYGMRSGANVGRAPTARPPGSQPYVSWDVVGPAEPALIAGAGIDPASAGGRLQTMARGEYRGTIRMTWGAPVGNATTSVWSAMCQAKIDSQGGVVYRPYTIYESENWSTTATGCEVDVNDLALKVSPGEETTVSARGKVRCDAAVTVGVSAYGIAVDRTIAFDSVGLSGAVMVQGKDATKVPVAMNVRPGIAQDLELTVRVKAEQVTGGGKATGIVIVVANPA